MAYLGLVQALTFQYYVSYCRLETPRIGAGETRTNDGVEARKTERRDNCDDGILVVIQCHLSAPPSERAYHGI